MAVAVKNASEAPPHSAMDRLAVVSLLGVLYVLGSIGIVCYAIPSAWSSLGLPQLLGSFVSPALELLVAVGAAVVLVIVGLLLMGRQPPHGLRAGIGVGVIGLLFIAFLTWAVGRILESTVFSSGSMVGGIITLAVGLGLLYLAGHLFFRPSFEETLAAIEDQGWFSRTQYKPSQGRMVRRGTMAAVIILFACGIFTLLAHHTLETGEPTWTIKVPFLESNDGAIEYHLTLLRDVRFTVPLLLAAAGLWIAFRVVNYPTFADFLIATEAEMNKVSWTTRKRLWQDTVVVLTTLVLMTIFLMVVDLFWGWMLNRVGVLQMESNRPEEEKIVQPW
jgi:preprotein translocase SecE subunit